MAATQQLELDPGNLPAYLLRMCDEFDPNLPFSILDLSGPTSVPDSEGYINFIYQVSQGGKSYIVKQGRPYITSGLDITDLPPERNRIEYHTYRMRDQIAPGTLPELYFFDADNHVFMMEDLRARGMRLMRFQLNEGTEFPLFARQAGTFLARNHFYTSELFLDKRVFREMEATFQCPRMREIMEDIAFLRDWRMPGNGPMFQVGRTMWAQPELRLALVAARDTLIKKSQCLVHGDFHPSNIFINQQEMRVIDMEYTYYGPFGQDVGYLLANFVSQYAAWEYHTEAPPEKRRDYQAYLLRTIDETFRVYFQCFKECFDKDAKGVYRDTPGYFEKHLYPEVFKDAVSLMVGPTITRIVGSAAFPDFDALQDPAAQLRAKGLALSIDEYILLHQAEFATPGDLVGAIQTARAGYLASI